MTDEQTPMRLLKIDDASFSRIMQLLMRTQPLGTGPDGRGDPRVDITALGEIAATFEHGGEPAAFLVRPIDMSTTGVRVLHGATVRPGSRCSIRMRDRDGKKAHIVGVVVRSRLISERAYEIGVRFDAPADIVRFVDHRAADEAA